MKEARLKEKYQKEVVKKLIEEFDIKNIMQVPRIGKVVVNSGVGDAQKNKEGFERLKNDIAMITGQSPSVRKARVSVASFGLRQGSPVGLKVTLRGSKMYDFLDKLFSVVLPRLRDFRGVRRNSFDKSGNYTIGIVEHNIFPEIDITKLSLRGLEITIVIKSDSLPQSFRLLELLGMPFEKGEKVKR
jgi:large subunit ribosomal protein L5